MTIAQKIIKYLATAFAIFLIVTIISIVLGIVNGFSYWLGMRKENEETNKDIKVTNFENTDINSLNIEISYANLKIKPGENLYLETNNEKIKSEIKNNTLYIEEKNKSWFNIDKNIEITLYIPTNTEYKDIKIKAGAGKVEIDQIYAEGFLFELGAGETFLNNINAVKYCKIESGAGKLSIHSSNINNLDLDMGIGEVYLNAKLIGKSDIDSGVGTLIAEVYGDKEEYKIKIKKGVGSVIVDGENMEDNQIIGNGESFIEVDGGIGSINISFINEII